MKSTHLLKDSVLQFAKSRGAYNASVVKFSRLELWLSLVSCSMLNTLILKENNEIFSCPSYLFSVLLGCDSPIATAAEFPEDPSGEMLVPKSTVVFF